MRVFRKSRFRVVRTDFDPDVWSGRALQVDFAELAVSGLASMYPVSDWSCFAPDHHGYQRACDLVNGQASTGHLGHQCAHALGRPNLHLVSSSRRPRLETAGLEILSIANSESLSSRFVFFTASAEECGLAMSAAAGAYGVIPKDVALEILVRSLRRVADGQRLLPLPPSDRAVPLERANIAIAENVLTVMTDRERQIMSLVSEGLSNKEIGRRLNITDGTIKVHLHHIYQKLEISNRTALAALVISNDGIARVLPGNRAPRVRLDDQRST
jgi:DNA-binding NarL/FixJ family response regulator